MGSHSQMAKYSLINLFCHLRMASHQLFSLALACTLWDTFPVPLFFLAFYEEGIKKYALEKNTCLLGEQMSSFIVLFPACRKLRTKRFFKNLKCGDTFANRDLLKSLLIMYLISLNSLSNGYRIILSKTFLSFFRLNYGYFGSVMFLWDQVLKPSSCFLFSWKDLLDATLIFSELFT